MFPITSLTHIVNSYEYSRKRQAIIDFSQKSMTKTKYFRLQFLIITLSFHYLSDIYSSLLYFFSKRQHGSNQVVHVLPFSKKAAWLKPISLDLDL